MRRVKFTTEDLPIARLDESQKQTGYFHQWGLATEYKSESIASATVAIVESVTTGVTYSVPVDGIQFIEDPDGNKHAAR